MFSLLDTIIANQSAPAKVIQTVNAPPANRNVSCAAIDMSNGRANMMSVGTLPWHGLGVAVDKATTSAEAIRFAGLDWTVDKTQLFYVDGTGTKREAADTFGVTRTDTGEILGTVGSRYKPIQNAAGFDLAITYLAHHEPILS